MADAMPFGKIPVVLNVIGALGKKLSQAGRRCWTYFSLTTSSLILGRHYNRLFEKMKQPASPSHLLLYVDEKKCLLFS